MEKLGAVALSSDILKKANIGLWAFELDEGSEPRMYADDAMLNLIGLEHQISPEETYHAWYDYIDPDHYDEVAEAVEKMTSGIHAEVQYPWHHPNGDIWVVRCGGVRNFAYTKGIRIEGTHQNVTELTHYEKKKLTDLLASLSENFLQVYFLDPYTGRFSSFAGNAFEGDDKRDYSKINFYEDVAERSGFIVHPDDKPTIDRMYSRENLISVLESGKPSEFIIRWPSGIGDECVYMKNRLVPFDDTDGTRKLVIGVVDVSREQMAEESLKEKNLYLEYFLKSFNSAYIVDLYNNTYEVLHMNGSFENVFTMNGDRSAMEHFIEEHIHPDDRELMKKMSDSSHVMQLLENENELSFTVREVFDDAVKTMRVFIVRGVDNTRATVAFMDISDEIEKEKEYSRKLEAANKAKSSFLFNMSHDIRTPMNAIIGFNEMALKHLGEPERVKDCLDKVNMSSHHLLSIINDVLDMARIESGKVIIEEVPVSMTKAAEELRDIVTQNVKDKNLTMITDFSQITHDLVLTDKLRVTRVMMNLISNSIKYTNPGGTVSYTVTEKAYSNDGTASYEFVVADNGIGMSPDFLEHVFEAFTRERTSTVSSIQGTGLGMAITKELVDLLGGTISITSEQGKGTTATVHFAFKTLNEQDIQSDEENTIVSTVDLNGKRILLVEDNELNREIATEILEESGMLVIQAENGQVAVEKYMNSVSSSEPFDVILMDVQMPVLDGYEATAKIRKAEETLHRHIPIIATTANAYAEDVSNCKKAGMDRHIAKPIDVPKLIATLSEILK